MSTPATRSVLYRGGDVYSPADPFATAMLVVGDTVAWVGSDDAAAGHAPTVDQVLDLDGALVTPAFVDAHAHVTETGLALTGLDLHDAVSLAQVLRRVEEAARRGGGRPILGTGWDERGWPEGRPPTRAELDRASYGGAVYLARVDVHSAVVSSSLAAAAGLADLDGWNDDGRVERDAHHAARDATRAALGPGLRHDLQRAALDAAAAAGIGALHEMSAPHIGGDDDLRALVELAAAGGTPSVLAYRGELVADEEQAREVVARLALGPGVLRGLAGDLCADGSIGSRTARLREPYADAPNTTGHAYVTAEQVRDHVAACTRAGLQAGFHVIGDGGLDVVLAGFVAAAEQVGESEVRGARHRLEHLEMPDPAAIEMLTRLGVHASVQPAFDAWWGGERGLYAERLGERARAMNPFASLAAAGVPLALGSDAPVTPFDPWGAVRACAFHSNPDQRISARAAFLAHTRGAWRAAGFDDRGVLVPGAPASFAVWAASELVVQAPDDRIQAWSTDPRSGTQGLPDLTPGAATPACLRTVVEGRVVFDAGALA
ncbi:amidohydrolase [Angustibacter sp. Root456]|uniref:amidohydrolase n=1 Tax=Angustibacter sp. Root456 TaxID=1736539 RepID=UPI000A4575D4|nr:amidohydrolase family protein [Angustibacter sp. Root456]